MIIVTCYYNIPSKQSKEFYYENIKRFFRKLGWQTIVFYTDQENYDNLKHFSGLNVVFVIKPFENLPIFTDFSQEFWKQQILLDPEKYHTWQVAALWASKSYFIKETSNNYVNDWFMWVDAGSVRTDTWDLVNFTRKRNFETPGIYLQLLNHIPKDKNFFRYPDSFVAGSHIVFHRSYIDVFIDNYKETIKKYVDATHPLINDQHVIASMTKFCPFLIPILYNNISCPDKWFFFFYVI